MSDSPISREMWSTVCGKIPKEEIVYFSQILIIFCVVVTCLVNLSINQGDKDSLWASLLSASVGYLLPNPKIKKKNDSFLPDTPE